MKIIDIAGTNRTIIKLKSLKVLEHKDQWTNVKTYDFPSSIIYVDRVDPRSRTHVYLTWTDLNSEWKGTYVPNDFEIEVIEGKDLEAIQPKLDEYNWAMLIKNLHMSMTTGNSAEFFMEDKNGNLIIPNKIFGSKSAPTTGAGYGNAYYKQLKVQTALSVFTCLDQHTTALQGGLRTMHNQLTDGARISPRSLISITPEVMAELTDKQVLFGDTKSLNIYGLKNEVPNFREVLTRPACGNIHFGIGDGLARSNAVTFVKALDAIVGVMCVSMFAGYDDVARRQYVGKPGSYRLKPYGLEYRVLSNAWAMHPMIQHITIDLARKVLAFANQGFLSKWKASEDEVVRCILNNDVALAREILSRNRNIMIKLIQSFHHRGEDNAALVMGIYLNGVNTACRNFTDVYRNWSLVGALGSVNASYRWASASAKIEVDVKV